MIQRLPEIPTMYVCLVSGLNIGSADSHRMQLQLFVDFITGHLGGPEEQEVAAQILHVIVAGNLVSRSKITSLISIHFALAI